MKRLIRDNGRGAHGRVLPSRDPSGDEGEFDIARGIDLRQGLKGAIVFRGEDEVKVVAPAFRTDPFREKSAERHNVGHHVNLQRARPRRSEQSDRARHTTGQRGKQERTNHEPAQPPPP
jgi:hypothetical protein